MNIKRIICRIKRQHLAFTLAEVMVTMTIVGFLAVMTIPTMIVNVQANQYKSGVKKAHSLVSESFDSMKSYEDESQNVSFNYIYNAFNNPNRQAQDFRVAYMEFWGFDKTKYAGQDASYYDNYYHTLHNKNVSVDSSLYNGGGFQARNGMTVLIGKVPKPDSDSSSASSTALIISVDIDGPKKGENQLGVDIFCFEVMPSDNILPVGAKSTAENTTSFDSEDYCVSPYNSDVLNGIACSYKAVHNADYMNDTLDTKDVCNCGSTLDQYGTCQSDGTIFCSYGREQAIDGTCKCVCKSKNGYSENTENGLCCKDGECLSKSGDTCTSINKHVDTATGKCVCNNGSTQDNCALSGSDDCDSYSIYDSSNSTCVKCENGKVPNAGKIECACPDKTTECDGKCVANTTATGAVFDKDSCEFKCPTGKTFTKDNGQCCDSTTSYGLKLDTDKSISGCTYDCGAGTYTSGKCICNDNAVNKIQSTGRDYSECVCNAEKHFTKTTNGSCVCETGRKRTGDSCYCENGSKEDDCGCDASYGLISSTTAGKCKCNTANGFKESGDVDVTYKGCACDAKHADPKLENGTLVCKCEGLGRSGADCSCGGGSTDTLLTENGNADDCTCKNGYEIDSTGSCICNGTVTTTSGEKYCEQTCKNGAKWSSSKKQCECDLQYAEISDDSCVCTLSGMTYNSTQNACVCLAKNATITYNTQTQEYECTQGGTSCTSNGQKRVNNTCQCQDGTLAISDEDTSTITERNNQVNALYRALKDNDEYNASSEELQQFQCYCPEGYSISLNNFTSSGTLNTTATNGSGYVKLLCENTACTGSYGTWNSEGGNQGSCSCGDNDYITSKNNTCVCKGEDVKEMKDVGHLSCECVDITNSKGTTLEYNTTKYTCVAQTGGIEDYYALGSKDDIEQAKVLNGSYNYVLANDIKIDKWTPWGTQDAPFSGNFDGNGKIITVTSITGDNNVGFFGVTGTGCNISNLTLKVTNVTGEKYVGALVGTNHCTLRNVHVILSGTVSGEEDVGGIVGKNEGTVEYATINGGTIKAQSNIGGAVGYNDENGNISYGEVNNVTIQGYYETTEETTEGETTTKQNSQYLGGFVGINNFGTIKNSYVNSDVTVGTHIENEGYFGERVGGFVGENTGNKGQGIILNSYTKANINAYSRAGGFVGYMDSGVLENVYTTSEIKSQTENYIGKFMGDFNSNNSVSIIKSFYKSDSTDKTDACGYSVEGEKTRYKIYEENCESKGLCEKNRGLYPKTETDFKNPQTYLCADWLLDEEYKKYKNIWYFPQTSSGYDYPQIINNYSCQAGGAKFEGDDKCVACTNTNEYYAKTTENKVGCLPMVEESGSCSYDNKCICLITQCDIGKHYDTSKKMCTEGECPKGGQIWKENQCMCPAGMSAEESEAKCHCATNNAYYEGYGCIDCTKYAKSYDGTKDVCVCDIGYYFEEAGMMCISNTTTKVE